MAKKTVNKEKLSKEEAMEKIDEILHQVDIDQAFIAVDFGKETATCIKMDGANDGEKLWNLEVMLVMVLCNLLPGKSKDCLTRGKVNLAHLISLDLAQKTLQLGATDFAEIKEEIMPEGDTESWVDHEDIESAMEDTEPIENDEEELDENAVKELENFLENLSKSGKTRKIKGGELVEVQAGKLSKEDAKHLVEALKGILGE